MFNSAQYCHRYFMRKQANLIASGLSFLGSALTNVGKGIGKHFGGSVGTTLSNWGTKATSKSIDMVAGGAASTEFKNLNTLKNIGKGGATIGSGGALMAASGGISDH